MLAGRLPDGAGSVTRALRFAPMKKEKSAGAEDQLLNLLKEVLPQATPDPKLAGRIYDAIERQLKTKVRAAAFEKFCRKVVLTDLDPKSVAEVKEQLTSAFADGDVTAKPDRKAKALAVEVSLADGARFSGEIPVNENANAETAEDPEAGLKFVAFPVALPTDPELVWILGKRENLTSPEAAMALEKVEEDFWASKAGQKLIRDRVERSFPEFLARVPAGLLGAGGLKRHYKDPETLQILRAAPEAAPAKGPRRPAAPRA